MSSETAATLSEQELFAVFLNTNVARVFDSVSTGRPYLPMSNLYSGGGYGELDHPTAIMADYLMADDAPEFTLGNLVVSLVNYAGQLEMVMEDFMDFKRLHSTAPEGPAPIDPAEAAAWQRAQEAHELDPRFFAPKKPEAELA